MVTPDDCYVVANNIEMPRIEDEELEDLPFKRLEYSWIVGEEQDIIREVAGSKGMATDLHLTCGSFDPELGRLRIPLTDAEIGTIRC